MLQEIKDALDIFIRYNVDAEFCVNSIDNLSICVRLDLDISDDDKEILDVLGWEYTGAGETSFWRKYVGQI